MKKMRKLAAGLLTLFMAAVCTVGGIGQNKQQVLAAEAETGLLQNAQAADEAGILKYIPNETVEESIMQQLLWYNENLLLYRSYWDPNKECSVFELVVLDGETGELLKKSTLSTVEIANVQICNGVLVVTDIQDGDVNFLDEELNVIESYKLAVQNCSIYVDATGTKLYAFTQDEGIKCLDTETEEETVYFENATGLFTSNVCGDHVTFTYTDEKTQLSECGRIDMATGETEMMPFEGTFYDISYNGDIWVACPFGDESGYYIGKHTRPNIFRPYEENSYITLLHDPDRIIVHSYSNEGQMFMKMYGLDGSFLSECTLPVGYSGCNHTPVWSEEDLGYYFTVIDDTGKDRLMFWDMTVPISGQSIELETLQAAEVIGEAVSEELYQKAAELSEKYQVKVYIAEQCTEEVSDFSFVKEMDETYVREGLQILEKALSSYPEGFLAQIPHGSLKSIEIHLVGGVLKNELPEEGSGGFTSFVGAASEEADKLVLGVDITRSWELEQTIYHELMHLINGKLEFDASMREDALYSEEGWNALNPEGFTYLETYDEVPDSVYSDGHDLYFIDIYSRTFAKEDRARIMEYGMIQADWMFISCEERTAKLQYLSDCIRDAFDTTGWPEVTVWEQTIAMVK